MTARPPRIRLDRLLVERGLAPSRERAQALVLGGHVRVAGQPAGKPGGEVPADVPLEVVSDDLPFVSRGGLKLAHALDHFAFDPTGHVALDVGASTGGFSDCLLQRGARRVLAVDVGYGQLAWKLRQDPRVFLLERQNVRTLAAEQLPERPTMAVSDVSFISLRLVLPKLAELLPPGAPAIVLIKPQFEVGKGQVGKGGVVRDPALRALAVADVLAAAAALGFRTEPVVPSPILGPAGNVEFLARLYAPETSSSSSS